MNRIRRVSLGLAACTLLASLSLVAGAAHADTAADAWKEAKAHLPAKPMMVFGMNFATIKSSQIFQQLWPMIMQQAGAQAKLDKFKAACGFDPLESIQGIVIVMENEKTVGAFVSTKNMDAKLLTSCAAKITDPDAKVTISPEKDGIVTLTPAKGKPAVIAFRPNHVLIASDSEATLKTILAAGGKVDATLTSALGKVNTNAAIWGVYNKASDIEPGQHMQLGYGQADLKGGNIAGELHVVMDDAAMAKKASDKGNKDLADMKASGKIPPQLADIIKSVKISAAGSELVVSGSVAEKEILGLLSMMGGM